MNEPLPPLSEAAQNFRPGIYRHYRTRGLYHAVFVGRYSEDPSQEFVVYIPLEHGDAWIRPLPLFVGEVEVDGVRQPRFAWVREA